MIDVPVVLVFFNRPQLLRSVWKTIEAARPTVLIALSDGPRTVEDRELVDQCRSLVAPTWDCEFVKIYRGENLGCRRNISTGLSEVFARFPAAIVLEDDCVPSPGFFVYCQELLRMYADDQRVFSITGTNQFAGGYEWTAGGDYAFSRYFQTWGWASWRRSWDECRWQRVPTWDDVADRLEGKTVFAQTLVFWQRLLGESGRVRTRDAWGFQACLTGLANSQYTIIPRTNLVENIGLGSGVHFNNKIVRWAMAEVRDLGEVIQYNPQIELDDIHDAMLERRHFEPNAIRRVLRRIFAGFEQPQ